MTALFVDGVTVRQLTLGGGKDIKKRDFHVVVRGHPERSSGCGEVKGNE